MTGTDNHKSLNNETGAGNTESGRVLIGWLLSRNAVGTTAGLSFPARTLEWGSRRASEAGEAVSRLSLSPVSWPGEPAVLIWNIL